MLCTTAFNTSNTIRTVTPAERHYSSRDSVFMNDVKEDTSDPSLLEPVVNKPELQTFVASSMALKRQL